MNQLIKKGHQGSSTSVWDMGGLSGHELRCVLKVSEETHMELVVLSLILYTDEGAVAKQKAARLIPTQRREGR
jgi:hypothetical protein